MRTAAIVAGSLVGLAVGWLIPMPRWAYPARLKTQAGGVNAPPYLHAKDGHDGDLTRLAVPAPPASPDARNEGRSDG